MLLFRSTENDGEGGQQIQREPQGWHRVFDRKRAGRGYC